MGIYKKTDGPNPSLCEQLSSPVLILDDSVHDLLHLLGEGLGVGGQLLGRGTPAFLLFLGAAAILVLVSAATSAGAGRGGARFDVAVLALASGLFGPHLILYLLQIALLYGL